jgi:LmbE family N-acetylglucosaminyl deacetylase
MDRRLFYSIASALAMLGVMSQHARAQRQGAERLHELIQGLTVTPRVLVIGVHPDDDDPSLIAWLARGRHVETGYLSLTRGEGGQNFLGGSSGVPLGATRVNESVAARRVDGGVSFFTRAYDFGNARNANDVWKQWDRDTLLTDVLMVIRSFRPHVVVAVFREDFKDGSGQHEVLGGIAREAFDAAGDTLRCAANRCGAPWTPSALFRHGDGLTVDAGEYNRVLGRTYVDLAIESRSQHRSQGLGELFDDSKRPAAIVRLRRVASREAAEAALASETSLFAGVDTSFARLAAGAPPPVAAALAAFAATADSVRATLDVVRPGLVVEKLARAAKLADEIRAGVRSCSHPSADARPSAALFSDHASARPRDVCDAPTLDLDASIDLVRRRTYEALLAAAGISIEATAEQELVADTDSLPVVVTVANHGVFPVTIGDVSVPSLPMSMAVLMQPTVVLPDSTMQFTRSAIGLGSARPWWVWSRSKNVFPMIRSAVNGVQHPLDVPAIFAMPGVGVPEEIRRTSDVRVTLSVAGALLSTSIGPIVHRSASAAAGVQARPVAAVPPVTLAFERGLEWMRAGKTIDRKLRLSLRSYSNTAQTFSLHVALAPAGVRVDSLPKQITLSPGEQRDVFVRMRGVLAADRHELGVIAHSTAKRTFFEGFQPVEYPHVAPVRMFRSSAMYVQAVKIEYPSTLVVAYVQGVGDGAELSLRQLGIPNRVMTADELPQADLSIFTTLVIGPRAFEAHPELVGQSARILDFARNGGTVLVLNAHHASRVPPVLPFAAALALPDPEHVFQPDATVTMLTPRSRVLTWPNRIDAGDFMGWVRSRALYVPTEVDPHFTRVLEMHDPDQRENANTLLVSPLGKGMFVYSTLTFFEQIPAGIPGSLRLFVNLLSAGCRPATGGSATC